MHLIFSPPLSLVPVLDAAPGWASWRCSRTSPGRPLPTCPCQGLGVPRGFMCHPCQGCHVEGKELCPRREARGHPTSQAFLPPVARPALRPVPRSPERRARPLIKTLGGDYD